MELKIIIKNTLKLAISKIVKLIVGFIKTKIAALLIGTEGIGAMNQFSFTTSKISDFSLLSMNHGVVKQIAERKSKDDYKEQIANVLKSYTLIISIVTIIVVCSLLLFIDNLTIWFFGDIKYKNIFIISIICIPLMIYNSWANSLLRAYKEIKYLARSEIYASIGALCVFVPAIYFFKLKGAIAGMAFVFIFILILNQFFAHKKILNKIKLSIKDIFKAKFIKLDIKELFLFAGIGITIGLYDIIAETFTRSVVVANLGLEGIGIYSPNIALSGMFTGFLLPSIFTYLFPRFAESKSNSEINGIINDVFRLISFTSIPFVLILIAFRFEVIPLLYSSEFNNAAIFLPGHMFGTLFYLYMSVFGQVFSPTGRVKIYGVFNFFLISLKILIVFIFVKRFGLMGYMLQFIIPPFIFFIIFLVYLIKNINFKFEKNNLWLFVYTCVTCIVTYGISLISIIAGMVCSLLLSGFMLIFLTKMEKRFIFEKYLNKKK